MRETGNCPTEMKSVQKLDCFHCYMAGAVCFCCRIIYDELCPGYLGLGKNRVRSGIGAGGCVYLCAVNHRHPSGWGVGGSLEPEAGDDAQRPGCGPGFCGGFLLFISGRLEIWHIYATTAFASTFQAFQWPAYSATVTMMVPKKHYSRASGMISMVESASNIIGPVLAGSLIGVIGIRGILLIDIITFFVALFTLLIVIVPQPVVEKTKTTFKEFCKDITFGFKFIFERRGLLGLQLVFFAANFMTVIGWAVINPMVLARTGDAQLLGFVQSFSAVGALVGGVFLAIWGGPKQMVAGILLGWILNGTFGSFSDGQQ